MTRWIRYLSEGDVVAYYELDDDGWALRQIELAGPERRPITAARLDEVLRIRDYENLAGMQAYERKFGVLASGSLDDWQEIGAVTEMSEADFELVWCAARRAVEQNSG